MEGSSGRGEAEIPVRQQSASKVENVEIPRVHVSVILVSMCRDKNDSHS